jgi:hypothetical protein
MRREQLSFGNGLISEEVDYLREAWMKHADEVLKDEHIGNGRVRSPGEAASQVPQSRPAQ